MYASLEVKQMAGCGGCRGRRGGISGSVIRRTNADLLSLEAVKSICSPCHDLMKQRGMTVIQKKFLSNLLEELNMELYEIIYKGKATSYNFFGRELKPFLPIYLTKDELPDSKYKISKLDDIHMSTIRTVNKPTDQEAFIKGAKIQGLPGIMWVGSASKRVNDYGTFIRNEPRFDLSPQVVEKLKLKDGFKVI